MDKNVVIYRTSNKREPFVEWLLSLKDKIIRERIQARIRRIEQGNFGDNKRFHGIIEVRLHSGKGYRL